VDVAEDDGSRECRDHARAFAGEDFVERTIRGAGEEVEGVFGDCANLADGARVVRGPGGGGEAKEHLGPAADRASVVDEGVVERAQAHLEAAVELLGRKRLAGVEEEASGPAVVRGEDGEGGAWEHEG
jgi:uncharacterized protein YjbJ (UPF0337 family)